jgi:RNA 3'-terminal phosphate cyclase (ATP)
MARVGVKVDLTLERVGFAPRGGGAITAQIHPVEHRLHPITALEPCRPTRIQVFSLQTSDLAMGKERRQSQAFLTEVRRQPKLVGQMCEMERREGQFDFAGSTGTVLCAVAEAAQGPVGFEVLGARDRRAEAVGQSAAAALLRFLQSAAAVDLHTAEQLVLPLALAAGPSSLSLPGSSTVLQSLMSLAETLVGARFATTGQEPLRLDIQPSPDAP